MPLIDLTFPAGSLPDKQQVGEELTTALLRAERAPDTDFFRSITWAYLHELPAENVLRAGAPADPPVFRVEATVPQGALSDRRKQEFVEAATAVLKDAAGVGDEDLIRIWVLVNEVPEGNWGAAGNVIHFEQLREAAKAEREKAAEPV